MRETPDWMGEDDPSDGCDEWTPVPHDSRQPREDLCKRLKEARELMKSASTPEKKSLGWQLVQELLKKARPYLTPEQHDHVLEEINETRRSLLRL
jgi:hypothetical protein